MSAGAWLLVRMIFAFPMLLYRGAVLRQLWFWFIVPLGAPPIGIAHALGLALILGCEFWSISITLERIKKATCGDQSEGQQLADAVIASVVGTTVLWGFGASIAWFMP